MRSLYSVLLLIKGFFAVFLVRRGSSFYGKRLYSYYLVSLASLAVFIMCAGIYLIVYASGSAGEFVNTLLVVGLWLTVQIFMAKVLGSAFVHSRELKDDENLNVKQAVEMVNT